MAKDIFHNTVKIALQKDGWKITHEPYQLRYGVADVYIDLAAEEAIAAEKEGRKIAVEVKSFAGNPPFLNSTLPSVNSSTIALPSKSLANQNVCCIWQCPPIPTKCFSDLNPQKLSSNVMKSD